MNKKNPYEYKKLEIFLDSASIDEIKSIGFIELDGVTTNPSLASKNIKDKSNKMNEYIKILTEISRIIPNGPISAEVISMTHNEMMIEALEFSKISNNIIIKLPITNDGLITCRELTQKHNIKTNMTLCFSPIQAIMAAKNGATYISPFIGRIDDASFDGMTLIKSIKEIFSNYDFETKILAASIRNLAHLIDCMKIGVDAVTVSKNVLNSGLKNIFTDNGLDLFMNDWNK